MTLPQFQGYLNQLHKIEKWKRGEDPNSKTPAEWMAEAVAKIKKTGKLPNA